MEQEAQEKSDNFMIPAAILVAGFVIAGAVIYSNSGWKTSRPAGGVVSAPVAPVSRSSAVENVRPVTAEDHILGSPNAPVKIIEFSDLECPFCKLFHQTLHRIIDEYGKRGEVAWVYRHFPLDQIHSQARKEAQAAECASELGGNEKFWAYVDRLFEITPSNNFLDLKELPQIAEDVGLLRVAFEDCLSGDSRGGKYADKIEAHYQDAVSSGGLGTPWTIVVAANGKKFSINGAQPYEQVKAVVEQALKEK